MIPTLYFQKPNHTFFYCFKVKFLCLFILLSLLILSNKTEAQTDHPNVILILGDDIGYNTLGVNGNTVYSTPNLDLMAQQGMNFTECHASPLCSPSRFMLLTGKYNFRNYTGWGAMDTSQRTIGNMFKDAGYTTACFGKWQLGGGDISLHNFGFDHYCVWEPFGPTETSRYKNPEIYTNGAYVPDSETLNKYGEDIFADSIINFIQNNKTNPFFIYYPMILGHWPFQPTPDDSDFAAWNTPRNSDTAYYASMMKYMDKKIGEVVAAVKNAGIENNTVIIYLGDNGSPVKISNYLNDDSTGGKASTYETGTRVPMIVYWPSVITGGSVNNDLIGLTDYLPSLAGIANISVPDYGALDGVSFAPRLTNNPGTPRDWLFYHYSPHPERANNLKRWAQTVEYKLYDTSSFNSTRLFYNIEKDPNEKNPIPDDSLTPDEVIIKQNLLDVINGYIAQGIPLLGDPALLSVTDTSATIIDSIAISGGSTISSSGVVWSTEDNPLLDSGNHTFENGYQGKFNSFIKGLSANTTYYVRTYATNIAGTAYSKTITFTTSPNAPVATNATEIIDTSFKANWNVAGGATDYKIDVSTSPTFSVAAIDSVVEGFNNGTATPAGWIFSSGLGTDTLDYGQTSPSIKFRNSNKSITTAVTSGSATQLRFWLKGLTNNAGSLLVEGFDGSKWKTIENITVLKGPYLKVYNAASSPALENGFIKFRFTYTQTTGGTAFDDLTIDYNSSNPSVVNGYNNLTATTNSQPVTGLQKNTHYYYRVRAEKDSISSGNSNVIEVITPNSFLNNAPVATSATRINYNSFVANWNSLAGADKYRVDVSTSPLFSISKDTLTTEAFNTGLVPSAGWIFNSGLTADSAVFGKASPGLRFNRSNQNITTSTYAGTIKKLSFFIKGYNSNTGSLLIEGFDGNTWKIIDNILNISSRRITKSYDSAALSAAGNNFIRFRFTFTKSGGTLVFDDVAVTYISTTPSFVQGYHDTIVKANSLRVTPVSNYAKYYYRVWGINDKLGDTSKISNTITATTCSKPVISNIVITNLTCNGDSSGAIDVTATGKLLSYSWTGPNSFSSSSEDITNLSAGTYQVAITSYGACEKDTSITISEPLPLNITSYADSIACSGGTTILTVTASGGTGNYHYTLSDGTNTTGPQDENYFTVRAGHYTVIVEDDKHCSFESDSIHIEDGVTACGLVSSSNEKEGKADLAIKQTITDKPYLNVFPNPAIEEFTLSVQTNSDVQTKVVISDLYGRKVYEFSLSGSGKYVFGNDLASGIYFAQVIQGNVLRTFKLIKEKK